MLVAAGIHAQRAASSGGSSLLALAATIEFSSIRFGAANASLVCHRHVGGADRIDLVHEDTDCLLNAFSRGEA
jgi:hypothetical protein